MSTSGRVDATRPTRRVIAFALLTMLCVLAYFLGTLLLGYAWLTAGGVDVPVPRPVAATVRVEIAAAWLLTTALLAGGIAWSGIRLRRGRSVVWVQLATFAAVVVVPFAGLLVVLGV